MTTIKTVSVHDTASKPAAGLKAQTFTMTLGGVDLLVGINGAGKTTRLIAVVGAVEGLANVPTDPRRPYVGGLPEETSVTVRTDNGTLTRDLSTGRGKAFDTANAEARKLIGVPPTAWDLSDFASGTDGQRSAILDAVARAGGAIEAWGRDEAVKRVSEIVGPERAGPLDVCIKAHPSAPDGATWLKSAEVWAIARQTVTNAEQRAASSASDEITAAAPPPVDGDDTARAAELHTRKAALQNVDTTAAARHSAEGVRLKENLDALFVEGKRLGIESPAVDPSYQARVDAAQRDVDAPVDAPDLAPLRAALAAVVVPVKPSDAAVVAAQAAVAGLVKPSDAAVVAARAALSAINTHGADAVCVHCNHSDPLGMGSKKEAAEAAVANAVAAYTAEQATYTTKLAAVEAAVSAAKTALASEDAAYTAAKTAQTRAQADLDAAANAGPAIAEARKRILSAAKADLAREVTRRDAAEAVRLQALTAARQRYSAAKAALDAWSRLPVPVVAEVDPMEIAAIDLELLQIKERDDRRAARASHIEQCKAALAKADHTRKVWEDTKALLEAVRQARNDLAAAAYAPIDTAAKSLLQHAPHLPQPYFTDCSDFGAEIQGRGRVQFAGLSESEGRITAAALVYALAVVAKNPCRLVLLDGIEVVQEDHRLELLAALGKAKADGHVDNVICTCAIKPGEDLAKYAIPGVTTHIINRVATTASVISDDEIPF